MPLEEAMVPVSLKLWIFTMSIGLMARTARISLQQHRTAKSSCTISIMAAWSSPASTSMLVKFIASNSILTKGFFYFPQVKMAQRGFGTSAIRTEKLVLSKLALQSDPAGLSTLARLMAFVTSNGPPLME